MISLHQPERRLDRGARGRRAYQNVIGGAPVAAEVLISGDRCGQRCCAEKVDRRVNDRQPDDQKREPVRQCGFPEHMRHVWRLRLSE